jgi:hypothetical protein
MTNPTNTTAAEYAAHLRSAVRENYLNEPERYGSCETWTDLHDVCDANDYLQDADDALGVVMPDGGLATPADNDEAFDRYVGFTNEAIALVEADWPITLETLRALYGGVSHLTGLTDGE